MAKRSTVVRIGDNAHVDANEWTARVDLAAAHRIADAFGWSQIIYNHFTVRVPGEPEHFLIKPNDLMFNEVTASSLVKLDMQGEPVDESQNINSAGYAIHAGVLKGRPDINAVAHIHTDVGMAIAAHPDGLRHMSQGSMRFYQRLSYHAYEGLSEVDEQESLQRSLGPTNKAMILENHGLLTCGETLAEAMTLMHYLYQAAKTQLNIEAAVGRDNVRVPPPEICERAARQWDEYAAAGYASEWAAMLRWADRLDPGFRQ
jgi:ribulose-5-phosphate 4-epimerase/fuculose-1-phosphate aldolase